MRTLKNHTYGRTNQFDVRSQLNGLDEKFRVLNNEPLADALKKRAEKLDKLTYQWKPEILSLLLNLSDRPVIKTSIESLDLIRPPESPPSLTWADIIAEDPLTEEGIWDKPDHGNDSSEDAYSLLSEDSSKVVQDALTSTLDEPDFSTAEHHIVEVDFTGLEAVEKAQFWRSGLSTDEYIDEVQFQENSQKITELQAIRECLFMLSGLQTHLFQFDRNNAHVNPTSCYSIKHISPKVFHQVLLEFAKVGSALSRLRQQISRKPSVPLIQTFHYAVERRIQQFHQVLGGIEQRFVAPSSPVTVSLQAVLSEVRSSISCLLELADLVGRIPSERSGPHYAGLELLYGQACDSQMLGNMESFQYFAQIFFECLQTYLKLVRRWMGDGELDPADKTFFVYVRNEDCDVSSLWHEQYALRESIDGSTHAPKFVQTVARRIFNTGKSVAFLKAIGKHESPNEESSGRRLLDYKNVCGEDAQLSIAPFAEVFLIAFEQWVKHQYHSSAQELHEQLDQQCGLWKTLDVFDYVYFSKDGSVFQDFAAGIFKRLERRRETWNDRYILTDLAQSTFGIIPGIDAQRLVVRPSFTKGKDADTNVINLAAFTIDYVYPWPVMNVIRKPTLIIYQQVFTFLLQVLYARHHLLRYEFLPPTGNGRDTKLAYSVRHRLLWFTNMIHNYIIEIVLAALTAQMRRRLAAAEDVDAMTEIHQTYATHLAAQCLLTKNLDPIHQAIKSVLNLASAFSEMQDIEAARPTMSASKGSSGSLLDRYTGARKSSRQSSERKATAGSDSEESDVDGGNEYGKLDRKSNQKLPYLERIHQVSDQFDDLHRFITAGLEGVSRAGGETSWAVLAEKLEWR